MGLNYTQAVIRQKVGRIILYSSLKFKFTFFFLKCLMIYTQVFFFNFDGK